ncbi:sigma 54-interacting transcriptional regulator, partial [Vibrio splendidus]
YERVGGQKALSANVRLVCATNADLPDMALRGEFRADLLDRLAFDVITIPPLRERKEDITLLAEYYAIKMCRELELELFVGFAPSAVEALLDYSWPGNVRELKNVIERAVYQHGKDPYPIESLVFNPFKPAWKIDQDSTHEIGNAPSNSHTSSESSFSLPLDYKAWQEQQDIKLLNQALKQSKYNQKQAAELLGLTYNQLRGMVRKYAIVGQANDK